MIVAVALLVLFKLVAIPIVAPGAPPIAFLGGLVGGLAIIVWWMFFSRAPWSERVGALVLMIVAVFLTSRVVHVSIADTGQGILLPIIAIPALGVALVAWALATRRLSSGARRATLVAVILLTCGMFAMLRISGLSGNGEFEFHWRWTPTPEQRLLAQAGQKPLDVARGAPPSSVPAAPVESPKEPPVAKISDTTATRAVDPSKPKPNAALPAVSDGRVTRVEWPGFRGAARDGIVRGVRINTDWVRIAADRNVAPADRAGLVIVRRPRRPSLHAGAAR